MDMNEKTTFDYIADVLSGRVQNTLEHLYRQNKAQQAQINKIEGDIKMATAIEQRILDMAQNINDNVGRINNVLETMREKIATLTAQAQSPSPTPVPEDLNDELNELQNALAGLGQVGTNLETSAPEIGAGDGSGSTGSGDVAVDNPAPVLEDMPAVEPTPLAGESGTTNPIVEGGGPVAGAQAPGTGTVPASEVEGAGEGTADTDVVAINPDGDVTTTPSVNELETGIPAESDVVVGDGGGTTSTPSGTTDSGETIAEAAEGDGSTEPTWR